MPVASSPPSAPSARERARRALRAEITAQALELIAQRGFDGVTADEIATAVGVSRRTLFRLFATKEDVVVAAFDDLGDGAVASLRARPGGEPAWTALRGALDDVVARLEVRPESFFAVQDVIGDSPALRGRLLEQRDRWRVGLADALRASAGRRATSLADDVLAAAAVGAFDVASERWARTRGRRRLGSLLDDAFGVLGSEVSVRQP